jgi:hypothetical protein
MYKTDEADKTVVAVTDCRPCGRPGAEAGLLYLDECASSFVQESWQATDDRLGMRLGQDHLIFRSTSNASFVHQHSLCRLRGLGQPFFPF